MTRKCFLFPFFLFSEHTSSQAKLSDTRSNPFAKLAQCPVITTSCQPQSRPYVVPVQVRQESECIHVISCIHCWIYESEAWRPPLQHRPAHPPSSSHPPRTQLLLLTNPGNVFPFPLIPINRNNLDQGNEPPLGGRCLTPHVASFFCQNEPAAESNSRGRDGNTRNKRKAGHPG